MRMTFVSVSLSAGGAERAISILATELARRGHDVDIILYANRRTVFYECEGVKIRFTDPTYSTGEAQHWERIDKLRKALIEAKSHIVISFLMLSNVYVHYAKTDQMIHVACERDDPFLIPLEEFVYNNRMVSVREADGAVFQSRYARDFYRGNLPKSVAVIHNALVQEYKCVQTKFREKSIIAVGRIAKQKNYELLLNAFKIFHDSYPTYVLKIFGGADDDFDNFISIMGKLGLEDSILYFNATKNIVDELAKAELFLMTSNYEGLSNSVLEAFDMRIPVVCVPLPGMMETVFKDSYNALIAERNPHTIAKAMERLIQDVELREKIVENAARTVNKFSVDKIIPQWEDFLYNIDKK